MMRKLRWVMDSDGFWEVDASTPRTLDGLARAVPGDPLPLGLSRGARLSRPRQLDFMQRFMAAPFVPLYAGDESRGGHGFALQRVLSVPFFQNWFGSVLGQFNVQKMVSAMKRSEENLDSASSRLQSISRHLKEKSLYAVGFCSELSLTPDDILLLCLDTYGDGKMSRKKAVFFHRFPNHDLTMEAVSPGLYVDKFGNYWDAPYSVTVDLASVGSESGPSYHLSMHHNSGFPQPYDRDWTNQLPTSLLPGLSIKSVFSFKKIIDIWKSTTQKLKMVQPYDIFLSNPHASASGIIGAAITTSFGDNSARAQIFDDSQGFNGFSLQAPGVKSSLLADLFASLSFTAQHGNFQSLFLDLTRFHARLDFPSGRKLISGAAHLAQDFFNSQQPSLDTFQAVCPSISVSFQQQIAGPFSCRVDSGIVVDLRSQIWNVRADEPIFAVEYALQVSFHPFCLSSPNATTYMMLTF